jgi:hypothetical protein
MKVFIVIPTTRNLNFLGFWGDAFKDCHLLIVEDHPKKKINPPEAQYLSVDHYSWKDIHDDFGPEEWIFSRRNAGIRCYGFWKAYQKKADVIITIDDDCYPTEDNFIKKHLRNLSARAPESWFATFPDPKHMFTRGFPYRIRNQKKVIVSHGLWSNKIDLDGKNQLLYPDINIPPYPPIRQFIPPGMYFPMCSMNLAFIRDATPLMYFPLMGFDKEGIYWGYDRFDDIWAGIFVKKITDHLCYAIVNGSPFVEHRKASDALKNKLREAQGIKINEYLWRAADNVNLTKTTPTECYKELAQKIEFPKEAYFVKLKQAMTIWAELF